MVACPTCGRDNPNDYRFCGDCGAALVPDGCPRCGAPHVEGQRFCGSCGSDLTVPLQGDPAFAGTARPMQERRLATVLFADVVGFTSLSERTDPEVVARMVDAAFRELGQVVTDHGGTIDKYMGDSLMAVFGVPLAHDDDAERAVAAALAMRKLGGDLVFSIGINSGEVMATPIGADGGVTVIGDTVNVAARLEKAAGPGEVLCGPLTVELVGARGVFKPRQPVILKGKREPVEVCEAVALRPATADVAPDDLLLIGRDDEVAYLGSIWQRAVRDRHFQMVLLCGDAGSGKTRVVSEMIHRVAGDATVVRAACPAYGAMGGVHVVADVLRQLGPADDDQVTSRVLSLAGKADESLRAMDPDSLRQEQLWGLERLLEEKADENPLLLVIDDVHRGTEVMLDVIGDLTARLSRVPLVMVLAGRAEPNSWLSHFPTATTVRLAPLGRTHAAELASSFVCDKPLAAEASDFLVERAGGNPLYMRELVRMARTTGSLVDDGDRYRLATAASVPVSLHALLAARLDALGPGQKLVFQHVALLGEGATLENVVGLGAAGVDGALLSLVDSGLLRRNHDGCHEVVDALLREVAYETLPHNVRGDLHKRAAMLATRQEDRARHLERAAEYLPDDAAVRAEAGEVLAVLGQEYAEGARYAEALRLLSRAEALGNRSPWALLKLADMQGRGGDERGASETLALIEDDPEDPAVAVERDHTAARLRMFSQPDWAREQLGDVASRWRELGEVRNEAWAIANAGVSSFTLNRMEDAAADLERAYTMFEGAGDRVGAVAASSFLCLVKPADRRVPGWMADALAFAEESGERMKQLSALSPLAWHHYLRSMWGGPADTAQAEGFAIRLAEVAEEVGADEMAIHGRSLAVLIARWTGRLDGALEQQEALARLLAAPGHREAWLGWAAGYSVAVAGGAVSAAPPFPPHDVADPVAGIAGLVIRAELAFAGRIEEASAQFQGVSHPHGAVADVAGTLDALTLVLAGRLEEARPWADRAATAAVVLGANPAELVVSALRAEISADRSLLPPAPEVASSIADAVVLREHAVFGDPAALESLRQTAKTFAVPGLLSGV